MNVCFSLLVGLSVCQADGSESATARVDEPNRIVLTTSDFGSPDQACGQPAACAQPPACAQPMACAQPAACGAPAPCGNACCFESGGCQTCNGCFGCNDCDDDCEDALDEWEDIREGGCLGCYCRSTCDMPPHFAYYPKYHGYYYFLPYNYTMVLRDMELVRSMNGDPRMPYATAIFESVYSEGVYEEATGYNRVPVPFATVSKTLPDLQDLLKD